MKAINERHYGPEPFRVVVVHGGPGAAGELTPLGRELGQERGVVEPWQTAMSFNEQVAELTDCLERADWPVVLIGHSYGALLGIVTTAQSPSLVKKLILVSSAVFEDSYAQQIMTMRRSRLSATENAELDSLLMAMDIAQDQLVRNDAFARFGDYLERTDAFDPLPKTNDPVSFRGDIYKSVWPEVAALRAEGQLLAYAQKITCPVVAIHGDYDPHPAAGVREPLERTLRDFKFIALDKCGHVPWRERQALEEFYRTLAFELES